MEVLIGILKTYIEMVKIACALMLIGFIILFIQMLVDEINHRKKNRSG